MGLLAVSRTLSDKDKSAQLTPIHGVGRSDHFIGAGPKQINAGRPNPPI